MRRPLALLGLCLGAITVAACSAPGPHLAPRPAATSSSSSTAAPVTRPPTSASASAAPPSRPVVLGLGDSVTTGWSCGCTDFIRAYAAQLPGSAGGPGRADNEGQGGLTAAQLASRLLSGLLRTNLQRADIVIVTIGANDLVPIVSSWAAGRCDTACGRAAVVPVKAAVGRVLDAVHAQVRASMRVVVTDYWNVFEDGDVARQVHGDSFAGWSDAVTRALDDGIGAQAVAHADQFVDLYAPFKGDRGEKDPTGLLAGDGDHPNAAGEALITRVLLRATT